MVGLIHECLLGFLTVNFGEQAVAAVKRAAGLDADLRFRIDTVYADDEWQRLYEAAIEQSGHARESFERSFARYCGEDLIVRFPGFLHGVERARDLIERQPTIHNNIAASIRGPSRREIGDKFSIEPRTDSTVVRYVSPNRMCGFYKGLAEWVGDHLGERVEVEEPRCLLRGDPACELHVHYLGPGRGPKR